MQSKSMWRKVICKFEKGQKKSIVLGRQNFTAKNYFGNGKFQKEKNKNVWGKLKYLLKNKSFCMKNLFCWDVKLIAKILEVKTFDGKQKFSNESKDNKYSRRLNFFFFKVKQKYLKETWQLEPIAWNS